MYVDCCEKKTEITLFRNSSVMIIIQFRFRKKTRDIMKTVIEILLVLLVLYSIYSYFEDHVRPPQRLFSQAHYKSLSDKKCSSIDQQYLLLSAKSNRPEKRHWTHICIFNNFSSDVVANTMSRFWDKMNMYLYAHIFGAHSWKYTHFIHILNVVYVLHIYSHGSHQ